VRIRIALTTVLAVITGLTAGILALSTRQAPPAHHASAAKHHSVLSNTALAGFAAATTTTTAPTTTTTTTGRREGNAGAAGSATAARAGSRDHRRHERLHTRLGVHPDPRIEQPVQQPGGPGRCLRYFAQHLALIRPDRTAISGPTDPAGPDRAGAVRALRIRTVELALCLWLVGQPAPSMADTCAMSK